MRLTWGMATWAACIVLLAAPILAQPAFLELNSNEKTALAEKPTEAPKAPEPPRFLASAPSEMPAEEVQSPLLPAPVSQTATEAADERDS